MTPTTTGAVSRVEGVSEGASTSTAPVPDLSRGLPGALYLVHADGTGAIWCRGSAIAADELLARQTDVHPVLWALLVRNPMVRTLPAAAVTDVTGSNDSGDDEPNLCGLCGVRVAYPPHTACGRCA